MTLTKDYTNYLLGGNPHQNRPNKIAKSVDFSNATWNTAASHEVFTVTGTIRGRLIIRCTSTLTDAADGASIQMGVAGATNALIASTGAAGAGGVTITSGNLWFSIAPANYGLSSSVVIDFIVSNGTDIGYEITGAALTGGTLEFDLYYEALNSTGAVVLGDGSAL